MGLFFYVTSGKQSHKDGWIVNSNVNDTLSNSETFENKPVSQPYFPSSECEYQHYSESEYIEFSSLQNFTLMESMGFLERMPLTEGVEGTLLVQRSTQLEPGVDIRLRIAYAATQTVHVGKSKYMRNNDSIAFELPDLENSQQYGSKKSCLGVFIGLEISPGLELDNFRLNTLNLDLVVVDGLFSQPGAVEDWHLMVKQESVLATKFGKSEVAYWSSPRTIVESGEGNIRGIFAMRDLLDFKTEDGNISALVIPELEDPDRSASAEFSAVSFSGTIDVDFPIIEEDLPQRDYRIRLETVSSPILGSYVAGTSFSANTTSGDILLDLLPFHTDKQPGTIFTDSGSGKTSLKFALAYAEDSWPDTLSEHKSISTNGSIEVIYPPQWEGVVDARTRSGQISIQGKGLEIIDEQDDLLLKHVTARKGERSNHVELKSDRADIDFRTEETWEGWG